MKIVDEKSETHAAAGAKRADRKVELNSATVFQSQPSLHPLPLTNYQLA
jgi:hypothetical protein